MFSTNKPDTAATTSSMVSPRQATAADTKEAALHDTSMIYKILKDAINLKAARALGLVILKNVLLQATEWIE